MTWLLVLGGALVAGGLGTALLTGGYQYDSGHLLEFIDGVVAVGLGVFCFILWGALRLLLKI